ncbi:MAG: sulfotransferase domain-containing protein [Lentisphaeria bacterium]|nr:sulfotransferase domain-containing protein [Lentisphaeria bacterium]
MKKIIRRKLLQWARPRLAREFETRFLRQSNLSRLTDRPDSDIIVTGYPKSGNTWFQHLLSGILYGVPGGRAPHELIELLVPDVDGTAYYRRLSDPMFFKSHHPSTHRYKRVIYLVRDGRDAMVSYYHWLKAEGRNDLRFSDLLDSPSLEYGCWHEHVDGWLANPYQADMLVVKYEDLKKKPVDILTEVCSFAGIDSDRQHLEWVIQECCFNNLQKKENTQGYYKNFKTFRRGVVGSYRDEMPEDFLAEFEKVAGPVLKRLGYL